MAAADDRFSSSTQALANPIVRKSKRRGTQALSEAGPGDAPARRLTLNRLPLEVVAPTVRAKLAVRRKRRLGAAQRQTPPRQAALFRVNPRASPSATSWQARKSTTAEGRYAIARRSSGAERSAWVTKSAFMSADNSFQWTSINAP